MYVKSACVARPNRRAAQPGDVTGLRLLACGSFTYFPEAGKGGGAAWFFLSYLLRFLPGSCPRATTWLNMCSSPAIPEEVSNFLADVDTFISDILKGENLSKRAKEKKDALIKKIKDIKSNYPQEFSEKGELEDGEEYEGPDSLSLASDRFDKEDEGPSDGNQYPPIAAQDLPCVLKSGYLEKRRKDHRFLGFEWQKRWCALSRTVFYYYGSDKDKQQKGEFAIDGYTVRMNNTLRKDEKKDCCFEIGAPDKRIYQFIAATPKEAEEWVQSIQFVLHDMGSESIPEDNEEYDDIEESGISTQGSIAPIDEEIYEELPEEETASVPAPAKVQEPRKQSHENASNVSGNKKTDYANFYQGMWDCTGDVPDELTFKRGDVIYILSKEYNRFGWWVGEMKGTIGLVPKAYIMEMYDIPEARA
ncbi:src kinase-associated phosphoprotein 2 [Hemicordylus capensis]|uniref:src kinase-associated phosphoprotein 2 n=1 Tax=Hemicordylus capensis TaxID=884348 RepID=UPI002302C9E4|nr:src kinase-associated phosphoprotein 2 [Hemicordylus capensis]